ncbi:TMEM165/GDT1 family protein [Candidatus Woesearchaeota archaeon]|nr:TMEM165/GDT1 family protein [Candidatus Woesearchaeota archaeon]
MALTPFLLAILFSILGEIVDKTQLVILGFALKYKSPYKVFLGGLAGHAIMDGFAILIGTFAGFTLQTFWLKYAIGALFIALGLWGFYKLYRKNKKKKHKKAEIHPSPFLTTFLVVLGTEIGDRTQIASGLLAAEYQVPITIFIGVTIGLALTIGLNVFIGTKLAEKLPKKTIKITSNIIFILFGLATILF